MRAGISWNKPDNKLERPAYLQPIYASFHSEIESRSGG